MPSSTHSIHHRLTSKPVASYLITGNQRPTKASCARIRHRSRSVALNFSLRAPSSFVLLTARWIGLASLLETRATAAAACSRSLRHSVVGLLRTDCGRLIGRPGENSDSDNAGRATGSEGQWTRAVSVAIVRACVLEVIVHAGN